MTEKHKVPLNPLLLARAREMRHSAAPAEQRLWACLRDRQLQGYEFRRQVPVGSFVADFFCAALTLVVELDGDSHAAEDRTPENLRTTLLQREGCNVIRFWNTDVFENLTGVLEAILQECERLDHRTPPHPDPLPEGEGIIARALEVLKSGRLVAFPTETVYGLGADATNRDAVLRIFRAKGRPATNPLICHVADERVARRYVRQWPEVASRLVERFWPGPLTVVLPRTDAIVADVTAGLETVGLRAPNHPLTLRLLREFDRPLAGPSANKSNHISPTTAEHVREELGDSVDLVLDGGPCMVGIESTVLDLSGGRPRILRPGAVTREQIEQVIGPVEAPRLVAEETAAAMAPGQQAVHYAPRAPAFRFDTSNRDRIPRDAVLLLLEDNDPQNYARHFYARLRELDRLHPIAIFIEMPPETPAWAAVRDRITRATQSF